MTEAQRLCLRGAGSRQQMDWTLTADGAPRWRHWGAPQDDCGPLPAPLLPPSTVEGDPQLDLCPVGGAGWMAHPALEGYRPGPDGNTDAAPRWERCTVAQHADGVDIVLDAPRQGLCWRQRWHYLAPADAWCVATTLTNTGARPYQLLWLAAATLPLPAGASRALSLGGPWAGEFREHWDTLPRGLWRLDNRRGRTSHDRFPGLMAGGDDLAEHDGEGWAVHLAFSGNHSILVDQLSDGRRQLQLGELLQGGEALIAPGASWQAPLAYLTFSAAGLAGLSAAFHAVLRHHVLPPAVAARPRPVHLNTWEAMYFDHDEARIAALAREAAAIGVERFVLDDGWFHRRDDDRAGLGDWWPDQRKYPHGLAPLAAQVTSLGMQFGLWVEPEMVNPDSALYRRHPDWVLGVPGAPQVLGRHQLVLDLTRPEVADYLFGQLDALLRTLPVSYLKWDMNRDLAPAAAASGAWLAGAQVRALYALLQRLRAAHPGVEIESCASGGARADYAILAFAERIWTSDCNDPLERVAIQRGFQRFFPPEVMGAHIGPAPAHTSGRQHRLDFRAAVAVAGHLGIEADLAALTAADKARLAQWVALHKQLRGDLHGAAVHQGADHDGVVWTGYWNATAGRGVLLVCRVAASRQRYPSPQRLPWLAGCARVRLTALAPNDLALPPGWEAYASGCVHAGSMLAASGLALPPMQPESAWLLALQAH